MLTQHHVRTAFVLSTLFSSLWCFLSQAWHSIQNLVLYIRFWLILCGMTTWGGFISTHCSLYLWMACYVWMKHSRNPTWVHWRRRGHLVALHRGAWHDLATSGGLQFYYVVTTMKLVKIYPMAHYFFNATEKKPVQHSQWRIAER